MSDKSVREAIALAYAKSVNPRSTRGNNFDHEQADAALAIISDAGYAVLPKEYEAKAKAWDELLSDIEADLSDLAPNGSAALYLGAVLRQAPRLLAKHSPKTEDER